MPMPDRRAVLRLATVSIGVGIVSPRLFAQEKAGEMLASMTGEVTPIGTSERAGRLARAQAVMREAGIDALLVEPEASLIG